jgi:hypothetical protein
MGRSANILLWLKQSKKQTIGQTVTLEAILNMATTTPEQQ